MLINAGTLDLENEEELTERKGNTNASYTMRGCFCILHFCKWSSYVFFLLKTLLHKGQTGKQGYNTKDVGGASWGTQRPTHVHLHPPLLRFHLYLSPFTLILFVTYSGVCCCWKYNFLRELPRGIIKGLIYLSNEGHYEGRLVLVFSPGSLYSDYCFTVFSLTQYSRC